ncbi:MAG: Gfo/Idh/MocA family oxidoreductase [Defluviitaleaceae bacterium]|nr:Gfo/Idh/MocA family oxidoreductase [Defluviitaleaceae bacterium]
MFKICIIGCGGIAENFHAPAIAKYCADYPDSYFAACCDIDVDKAKTVAEKFGLKNYYNNYKEMIQAEQPHAVCILTSYSATPAIAIDIINMGIPVMMEKPPGATGDGVLQIANAARDKQVITQVAFNRRFTPLAVKFKEMIHADKSPVCCLRCTFQRIERYDEDFHTTAIHGIDTLRYLIGSDYKHIRFRYQELYEIGRYVANVHLDCYFETGNMAQLVFYPCAGKVIEDYYATCENSDYILKMPVWGSPEYPGGITHYKRNEIKTYIDGNDIGFGTEMFEKFGFYSENEDFFNNVKAKRKSVNGIDSAYQSVVIAECIQKRLAEYTGA